MNRILRMNQVMEVTGLSKATIYRRIKEGRFPKQVPIAVRAVGFRASDIQAWLDGLEQDA